MKKFKVNIVLEILGRPKEHILEAMGLLIKRLEKEQGVLILEQTTHEPVPVKDSKDLFTTFSEVMLEMDGISNIFAIMFSYMPSHIEIISPQELQLRNIDFNDVLNRLAARLHEYDAITKKASYESQVLTRKLKEVAPHLFNPPQQNQNTQITPQEKPSNKKLKKSNISKKK